MKRNPRPRASLASRLRQILRHAIWAGLMVNVGLVPLFWLTDIPLLAGFSVFSAGFYAGCLSLLSRRRVFVVIVLTYLDVVIHVAVVVLALGWDGGFQYYFIVILPLVFIGSAGYPKTSAAVAASLAVAFLFLDSVAHSMPPLVDIDPAVLRYIRHFNSLAAFGLASYVAWSYTRIVRRAERDLAAAANTDLLSGLLNRRRAGEMIRREIARCERSGQPVSFLLADIDDFKAINDRYGHEVGDAAIRFVSDRIAATVRNVDIVARWGGEEFLVALPDTPAADALAVAERIRLGLSSRPLETWQGPVSITMTLGVTDFIQGQSVEQCLARADEALYAGKRAGKNIVEMAVTAGALKPSGSEGVT